MTDFWLLDALALLGAASLMCTLGVVAWVVVESITEERRARELRDRELRDPEAIRARFQDELEFALWQASEVDRVWTGEQAA